MNFPEHMDEHIADRCVAGLKNDYRVSDADAKDLRDAILGNIKLNRTNPDSDEFHESVRVMGEITARIKSAGK